MSKKGVILSSGNISHYHHAALALQNAGVLDHYLCTLSGNEQDMWWGKLLPENEIKRLKGKILPGLDPSLIHTMPMPYLISQALCRLGIINFNQTNALFSSLYNFHAKRFIKKKDVRVFHYVTNMGLGVARDLRKRGTTIICDVRSQHIDIQEKLLQEEFENLGLTYQSNESLLRTSFLEEYEISDFIFTPSEYVTNSFIEKGISPLKLFTIPYGTNTTTYYNEQSPSPVENTLRPFRILYVGQLNPGKGLHYLIKAFIKLNLPQSELVIFGSGNQNYKSFLDSIIPTNMDNIKFLGHVPQIKLREFYQNSDVFVLPSLSEGSALVIYEAMAAGLPIITTPNSGSVVRDGEDGYIIPIRDSEMLQEKIALLYENPDLRKNLAIKSLQRIQDFSWKQYRNRFTEVYEQIGVISKQ